jgi:hypothetical protein
VCFVYGCLLRLDCFARDSDSASLSISRPSLHAFRNSSKALLACATALLNVDTPRTHARADPSTAARLLHPSLSEGEASVRRARGSGPWGSNILRGLARCSARRRMPTATSTMTCCSGCPYMQCAYRRVTQRSLSLCHVLCHVLCYAMRCSCVLSRYCAAL